MTTKLALRSHLAPREDRALITQRLAQTTYVGIDFGTSTTVASYVALGSGDQPLVTRPLSIEQPLPDGGLFSDYLVPTALAWNEGRLYFGEGALRGKARSRGKNYWAGFKMELGLDLGPQYYDSELGEGHSEVTILTPKDAAGEFLCLMVMGIKKEIRRLGLPERLEYSVSIPASFEANQRRDLVEALVAAGIAVDDNLLVDEPNAAFLSYLVEANRDGIESLTIPECDSLKVMVFDFGAGTCDVSILETWIDGVQLVAKNLSISRFEALGGNNIDRFIAREVLLSQLEQQNNIENGGWRSPDLKKRIYPVLQEIAEKLKIRLCDSVARNMNGRRLPDFAASEEYVKLPGDYNIPLPRRKLRFSMPRLAYREFYSIMERFLDPESHGDSPSEDSLDAVFSIFTPIHSALAKAALDRKDLDMVLLIGGSSENPYLQHRIGKVMDERVVVVPSNLRAHVSVGAAINSFLVHALERPFVRPITSEAIMVLARDEKLRTLVPAGTEMPSSLFEIDSLEIADVHQRLVEIPICVSNAAKILSVVRLESPGSRQFNRGERVCLHASLTVDKLLNIEASVGGKAVQSSLVSPFANRELTTQERLVLEAEREAYIAAAKQSGRPEAKTLEKLVDAYAVAGKHARAAETCEVLTRIDSEGGHETSACFHWSRAGREDLSLMWAQRAYEKQPGCVSAYNLAISLEDEPEQFEQLLREALKYNPDYPSALWVLGQYLEKEAPDEGHQLIRKAYRCLEAEFRDDSLDTNGCWLFARVARALGKEGFAREAKARAAHMERTAGIFDPANLVRASETRGRLAGKIAIRKVGR